MIFISLEIKIVNLFRNYLMYPHYTIINIRETKNMFLLYFSIFIIRLSGMRTVFTNDIYTCFLLTSSVIESKNSEMSHSFSKYFAAEQRVFSALQEQYCL